MGGPGAAPAQAEVRHPQGGRPAADTREVVHAVWYLPRSGTSWRPLPHDFPPWQAAYTRFRLWRLGGVWEAAHALPPGAVREAAGVGTDATPTPEARRVGSQTVKAAVARGGTAGE